MKENPFKKFSRDNIRDAREIKEEVKEQETYLAGKVSKRKKIF